ATPAGEPVSEPPWRTARSEAPVEELRPPEQELRAPEEPSLLRRAANDDRESIGQILRTLQRRPGHTSYVTATVFAGLWVLAGLVLGWMYLPELQLALGPSGLAAPVLAMLGVVFLVPIIFFYVLAHMAWRSQELRLITQSMAEVAMRLAEPETVARESIVTVGQAIRREVTAMGDGVERALARAAELETLVANEVSALEHAYNDNEVRIRALLQDLGSQRDTLVGQADQIRDAINSIHLDLGQDISQISELVAEQVNEAARRITHTLAANLQHTMSVRLDRVADGFSQKSAGILDLLTGRTQQLTELVVETGNNLADAIANRVEEVHTSLKTTGDSLVLDLSLRGGDVVNKLEQTGARITDTIVQRGNKVSDTFRESAEQLADVIGSRGDAVREMLANRLQPFEDMFNHGGSELADRIARDSTPLGNLVARHLGVCD